MILKRISPCDSLMMSINENGLDGIIHTNTIDKIVDSLDRKVDEQIEKRHTSTVIDPDIKTGIRELINVAFSKVKLDEVSKENMSEFMWKKTKRYLTSGFTQPYSSIVKGGYFNYERLKVKMEHEMVKEVEGTLSQLNRQYQSTVEKSNFQQLLCNYSPDSRLSKCISIGIKEVMSKYDRLKDLKITVGGQIKLHAPKICDVDSVVWHFDGDPMFIKVLCFLSSQPEPDGSFCIRSNFRNNLYTGSHIRTILQSINWNETCKFIQLPCLKDYSIFLLSSHMPMLNKRGSRKEFSSDSTTEIVDPAYLSAVVFKGVECLHRGGDNRRFSRPVFQGLVSGIRN
ncbi:hypothetical protein [Prochlorococcus marinus]|uniref:hypothetical protein n=1 Tax=Prochlorococcus TaxID=1218 RepID=UPI0007B3DB59|nr:hypothetical protein [Prochlorococcus marinus]